MIKKLICYIRAVPLFLKCGAWSPHLFEEVERHECIVVSGENYFRESKDLRHLPGERVCRNATVITSKCIRCGVTEEAWFNGNEEDIPKI